MPRRRLGAQLRQLREAKGLKLEDVAAELECSTSKISRLETGKGIPRLRDVRDLLALLSLEPGAKYDRLMRWAREGTAEGWWAEFSDVFTNDPSLPDHFDTYVALESDCDRIVAFEPTLVHGLLQTRRYARAVIAEYSPDATESTLERLVDLRMRRQDRLTTGSTAALDVVLDEACLHRVIGGRSVFDEQLEHLIEAAEWDNVDLRVLPFVAGEHPSLSGSYFILEFDDVADQNVLYIEIPVGTIFRDDPAEVARYGGIHQRIKARALRPTESLDLIKSFADSSPTKG